MGITQGLTEFAPVSSSGHLILVPWLFGWDFVNQAAFNKTFDVALHLGTLIGAVIYFRDDIWRYAKAFMRSLRARSASTPDERLAWAIVIGTIPGAIAGASFEEVIQEKLGQPFLIAVMMTVFAAILYAADRFSRSDRHWDSIGPRTGLGLGVAQALALQPGVSRSGVTISAARMIGLDRESAARFSFLLALPIIAGAGLLKTIDLIQDPSMLNGMVAPFIAGMVSAAISGFLVIWFLLSYLRKHNFALFLWYRIGVTVVVFALIATGLRPATI
jgi:undecaprenyl-diphosphatase